MPGGQFLELLLLKWSDFDNSKIAAGYFTHNYGLDQDMCEVQYPKDLFCCVLVIVRAKRAGRVVSRILRTFADGVPRRFQLASATVSS